MPQTPPQTPLVTAAGFLICDGRLLLGLRAAWKQAYPLCWDAIGGRLEAGEGVEDALVRELGEEIGIGATSHVLLGTVEAPLSGNGLPARHHIFAVYDWTGTPWNACDEHDALRWFSPAELAGLPNLALSAYPRLARIAVEGETARRQAPGTAP
ncbi:MAG: NUDIX domain-containing protein [Sphingobium sp.]